MAKKKKSTKPICTICCAEYTKEARAPIECGHCDFTACKQCVRRYLLSKSDSYHCMNCKNKWDLQFAREKLNSAFIDGSYKKHRKQLLFDIEKARLPETMPYVEKYLSIKPMEEENVELLGEITRLTDIIHQLRRKHTINKNRVIAYKKGNYNFNKGKGEKKEKSVFMKGCPIADCRGFLSSQWKCGVCKIFVCNKCLEPIGNTKDSDHECNEASVKTAQMLKRETKNCPSCAAVIYKISGCDQMWCTQCHIAFSWKTGQKVNGVIHNPHFYQWQKNNGGNTQNPQAVHCGGIPDYYYYRNKIRNLQTILGVEMTNTLMRMHRAATHFVHVELEGLRRKLQRHIDNTDLRVQYLAKDISETEIKRKLATRDTSRMKARAILDIYELFNTIITESLVTVHNIADTVHNTKPDKVIESICQEVDKISRVRCYCNKQLSNVSFTYRQKVGLIKVSLYTESEKFTSKTMFLTNTMTQRYFIQPYKWEYKNHKLTMKRCTDY